MLGKWTLRSTEHEERNASLVYYITVGVITVFMALGGLALYWRL